MPLSVAIIGRPNVGKSTLFNRLVGQRIALVDDTPGVTRDRREGDARLADLRFRVIDTAGLEEVQGDVLEARMREQTDQAIDEADICLMLVDARAGVVPIDEHFAQVLRRQNKPVILLANKCEGESGRNGYFEAFKLGLGDPVALSAEHGEGLEDLYTALVPHVDAHKEDEAVTDVDIGEDGEFAEGLEFDPTKPLRLAVVGRPNVGKSTLVNTILGEERMLTGPEAGITRDTISSTLKWGERAVKLFDTAGMRRKARVNEKLEKLSVGDSLRAIRFAEVVVLMIDARSPFDKQDLQIADLIVREGRAIVIAISKWDLVEDKQDVRLALNEMVERLLPQIRDVPLITLSGLTGRGVDKLLPAVFKVYEVWNKRISTAQVNKWLEGALAKHPPPASKGRRIAIRYGSQIKVRPPTFSLFSSRADELPESYRRYLVNSLREIFDFPAVPIRLFLRKGKNPFEGKKKPKVKPRDRRKARNKSPK